MQPLQTFPSRQLLYEAAAARLETALRDGIRAVGEGCAALSGGTTPEPAYALLSARNLNWSRTRFALVDERFVPPDHPDSNEAMLRRALRKPLERGAQLTPLYAPTNLDNAASAANAAYAGLMFNIAILGMGADGHTASWFPGSPQLAAALDPATARSVIAVEAPKAAGSAERLTMTLAAVARAEQVLLLITGADKFATISAALHNGPERAPVAALFDACAGKLDIFWSA